MANSWVIHFFQRHKTDDPGKTVPGRDFLDDCPESVRAKMLAALQAVAAAPPPAFSGGGYWEAMHGSMTGYYEIRVDGPKRRHYRLFCLLERNGADPKLELGAPSIVIIDGREKAFLTKLKEKEYAAVRALGDEYKARTPRSVLK